MRLANFLLISGLLGASLTAAAQVPATDTTRATVPRPAASRDSVRVTPGNIDSLERARVPLVRMKFSPRQITRRSMIIPGWGQATMKQYWALPIIYAGFGTLFYSVGWNNRNLAKWQTAYDIVGPKVYPTREMIDAGAVPDPGATYPVDGVERTFTVIQQGRKQYLRWRDMSFIGMAFLYGLNVVQANVSAHLKTFDETDDISLRITPGARSTFGVTPFGATVTLAFSSKLSR